MQNEDQSHMVANTTAFSANLVETHGELILHTANLAATSHHASNDKRSADISSLDNLRIKPLRASIFRGRMNDT